MSKLLKLVALVAIVLVTVSCRLASSTPGQVTSQHGENEKRPVATGCPGLSCYSPSWSPDGSKIVVKVDDSPSGPLMVGDADLAKFSDLFGGRDSKAFPPIGQALGSSTPLVEPTRVVTAEVRIGPAKPSGYPPGTFSQPTWSPTGNRVAFYYIPAESSTLAQGIYAFDVNSQQITLMVPLPNSSAGGGLSWSADERRLLYIRYDDQDRAWICTANSDGTDEKLLLQISFPALAAWSPDSNQVAFTSGGRDNTDLYVMNSDGTEVVNLTNNGGTEREYAVAWSPDSKRLVFTSFGERDSHRYLLYVINADGTNKQLVADGAYYVDVAWSPDGKWLMLTELITSEKDPHGYTTLAKLEVDF